MSSVDLDSLVEMISDIVRGGLTPDQAYKKLCKIGIVPELARKAQTIFEEQTNRIRTLKEPASLEERGLYSWYLGPSPTDRYWPSLHRLLFERNWKTEAIASVDQASTKVVSLL